MKLKIISGGQTGADTGGLQAAKALGISTGGYAPQGWLRETGPDKGLLSGYGLRECPFPGYPARTMANVKEADISIIFVYSELTSAGTAQTIQFCKQKGKSRLVIDPRTTASEWACAQFIKDHCEPSKPFLVINVAGSRETKAPGISCEVQDTLISAVEILRNKGVIIE